MPIKLIRCDITKLKCDAIVDPTSTSLIPDGGTDMDIHRAAGAELLSECREHGRINTGDAIITKGYGLPSKYVIHTAGPVWQGGDRGEQELLESCYKNVLRLALENNCSSVAIPLISSGRYNYPKDSVLKVAIRVICDFLTEADMLVYLVVFDKTSFAVSERLFADVTSYIDANLTDEETSLAKRMVFSTPAPSMASSCRDSCDDLSLDDMLDNMDKSFAETLFFYIDKKGLTDVECYKRANVDKKTFSKIKCNKNYRPSKVTAVSFAIALRLTLEETDHLLRTAGLSLSRSNKFDVIIQYFLITGNYQSIHDVNETLYQLDQVTLGV